MKRFLAWLVFLCLLGSGYAASGGNYNVSVDASTLQGGVANSTNYSATFLLSDQPGMRVCGTYSANIGVYGGACPAVCGNGIKEDGEQCDNGANNGICPKTCSNSCRRYTCSDDSGGGGGGGGGGGAASKFNASINISKTEDEKVGSIENTDAHLWLNIKKNGTIAYNTKPGIAFTHVEMRFTDFTETVRVNIQQFNGKPTAVPEMPGAYKYLSIDHSGLEAVDNRTVQFTVPASWFTEQRIAPESVKLYRLEKSTWVGYDALIINRSASTLTYSAILPGFSYFVIAGKAETPIVETSPVLTPTPDPTPVAQEQPKTVTGAATATPAQVAELEEETAGPAEKGGIGMLLWVLIGVVIAGVGTFAVFKFRKPGTTPAQPAEKKAEQPFEQPIGEPNAGPQGAGQTAQPKHELPPEHDPGHVVRDYILQMRAYGASDHEIRERLMAVGWDPLIIDMEMMRE